MTGSTPNLMRRLLDGLMGCWKPSRASEVFLYAAHRLRKARTIRRKYDRYSMTPTGFYLWSESRKYLCFTSGIARGIAPEPKTFFKGNGIYCLIGGQCHMLAKSWLTWGL